MDKKLTIQEITNLSETLKRVGIHGRKSYPRLSSNASAIDRFAAKIVVNEKTGCWEWQGSLNKGYGQFCVNGTMTSSHRFIYSYLFGNLPAKASSMELDHFVCNNTVCCNPEHLELVTNLINRQRRIERITHCPLGHSYSGKNLYVYGNNRMCRKCKRLNDYKRRELSNPNRNRRIFYFTEFDYVSG
jgi:hypothetical protein